MKRIFLLDEIGSVAKEILQLCGSKNILLFNAGMGTGKTTIISALCMQLGVSSAVSSPTFSIINEYATSTGSSVYHLDLYRIKNQQEAIAAGVEDVILSGDICLIEWPEVIARLLPEDNIQINIKVVEDGKRLIEIKL